MPKGKGQAKPLKPSKAKAAGGPEDTASIVLLKLKAKAAAPKAKAKAKAAAPKAKAPSMKRPSTVTATSEPSTLTSESVKQWFSSVPQPVKQIIKDCSSAVCELGFLRSAIEDMEDGHINRTLALDQMQTDLCNAISWEKGLQSYLKILKIRHAKANADISKALDSLELCFPDSEHD